MDKAEHADEWLRHADDDYNAAMYLKESHRSLNKIICYHCQQAGEKALKAVLAYHDEDIPRTYNLTTLLGLCETHCPGITNIFIDQSDYLTGFAVITRYPNEIEITEADMESAIEIAEKLISFVKSLWE